MAWRTLWRGREAMLPPLFARPPTDTAEEPHPPARQRQARARQLAAARPYRRLELGRRPGRPDRHPARLPPPYRLPLAAPLQRRRHRRPETGPAWAAPRLSALDRGQIIALASSDPPGLRRQLEGTLGLHRPERADRPAQWTLDALAAAAQAEGIRVGRSQVRRILLAEGARWRQPRSWTTSTDPEFVPKGRRSSPSTPARRRT
jgi:hypothetical protein